MENVMKHLSATAAKPWKALLLLTSVILIVYFPIFQNSFIASYDDGDFFMQWEEVKSLEYMPSLLSGSLPLKHQHVYRPLRSVTQAVMYQISATRPFAYHLFALLIHITCTYLVFAIIKTLRDKDTGLIAALFFAVLPVHVESITFITASFDTVGILLVLLSFYLYVLFREHKRGVLLLWSIITAALSFFTYEISLILPLLFILYEIAIRKIPKTDWSKLGKRLIPFLAIEALYIFVKYAIIGKTYFGSFIQHLTLYQRLINGAKAFVQYLYLVIVNYPLTVLHDMRISTSLADSSVHAALLVIAVYVYIVWRLFKKNQRLYAFLMLWLLISLLPVANIIQIASFVTERYLYLASLSWVMFLALIFTGIFSSSKSAKTVRLTAFVLMSVLFLGYASISWARTSQWKDDVTFWTATIKHQPDYVGAYINFAFYYAQEEKNYEMAASLLKKALELDPDNALALGNAGLILMQQEQYGKAIITFNKALETETNNASFYLSRGLSYHNIGKTDEAMKDYQEALRLYPNFYEANFNLAVLYVEAGRFDDAIPLFARAVRLRPQDGESYYGLGRAYVGKRDFAKAREYLNTALKINPAFAPALELLKQL